jgi:solute carrier family 9B (sodium/hydrogen exchanger), member 1/2
MLLTLFMILSIAVILHRMKAFIKVPLLVMYILMGMLLGPFLLDVLSRDFIDVGMYVRVIALVIILLRAGLKLDLKTLRLLGYKVYVLSIIPALLEATLVALLSVSLLGFDTYQAILLGLILASVSPAVIIPSMIQLIKKYPDKKLFTLILSAASLEDALMIIIFTSFIGSGSIPVVLKELPLIVLSGIVFGILFGYLFNRLLKLHMRYMTHAVSVLIVILGFIVIYFKDMIPIYFSGYVFIFVLGMTLNTLSKSTVEILETHLKPMWSVFELLLFTLLGSSLALSALAELEFVMLIVILIPLALKLIFVYIMNSDLKPKERLFMALSFSPKATVQASLAPIPLLIGLSLGGPILVMGILSILLTAPLASTLIFYMKERLY